MLRSLMLSLVALVLLSGGLAHAQAPVCTPTKTAINTQGAMGDVAIGATATQVLDANQAVCQRLLRNNGTAAMRCLPTPQGAPTATNGLLLNAGEQILLGTEGRQAWQCIRTTSTSTTATTIEGIP
jgi:hypothetical protein